MDRKGFTLVEALVVMGIILMLSSFAIFYNRSNEKQLKLAKDQATLVNMLTQAKLLAAERFNEPPGPNLSNCAFGLHFEPATTTYVLFRDLGQDGCSNANGGYDAVSSPPEALETVSLSHRVLFSNIPSSGLDIIFVPPELVVSSTEPFPVNITIQTEEGDFFMTISISAAGQISVIQ